MFIKTKEEMKMDFGKNLQDSFTLYFKNFGLLLGATLVAAILSGVTLGILAGPLVGGLLILGLKLLHGEKGEFNEIFAHFDQFGPLFLITVCLWIAMLVNMIIGWIPFIGWIFSLIIGPAVSILYFIAIGLVVKEKKTVQDALQQAINYCSGEPLLIWVYALVVSILAGIGVVIFGVGAIFTMPFGVAAMAVAYGQLTVKENPSLKLEKKMLQIMCISLGVLLIVGIVCRACFGFGFSRWSAHNRPGNFLTERILGAATGQKVQINNNGKSVKIGNLNIVTGLPDDFPKDIPLYPEAKVGGTLGSKGDFTTTFMTKDSAKDVAAYYATKLKDQGWEVTTSQLGEMEMINFKKEGRSGNVTATTSPSETSILLNYKAKDN
jgi:hypothetical protein